MSSFIMQREPRDNAANGICDAKGLVDDSCTTHQSRITAMKDVETSKKLSPKEREELLETLQARFQKNMNRHKGHERSKIKTKLAANAAKLWSLHMMEVTGGEPDVVGQDKNTGEYLFFDCSAQTPSGRV